MVNLKSKFLGIVYIIAGLSGCQDKELLYSAPPELNAYVQIFLEEAAHRGKHIDLYAEGLVVNFGTLSRGKAGRCRPNDFPKQITIDSSQWEKLDAPQREVLVFHELGHCILNRDHNNDKLPFGECASLMDGNDEEGSFVCSNNYYTSQWRKYYLDELFDPDTPLPSWYQIPDINHLYENLRYKQSTKDTCFICTPLRKFYRVTDTL